MTDETHGMQHASVNETDMLDFANDALEIEERIAVARILSKMPNEAADTLGYIADRDELLLALGLRQRMDDYPSLPESLPPASFDDQAMFNAHIAKGRRGFKSRLGVSLATFAAVGFFALMGLNAVPRGSEVLLKSALQANDLAQMRLTMLTMDEDLVVDSDEIQRVAGLTLPDHPSAWVLRDTQLIPSQDGVSVLRTFETGEDGLVTLYIVRGTHDAPQLPSRIALADGQGAWFHHEGAEYVLIGRQARAPLDDDAALLLASFAPA
ncbi:hypothetical protein EDD53_1338 [Pacificibacter maritimus]|uniref:Anti-sigma factor RsiW n=1 Tax=Pacificibacter maritimus TaxID=762213 RepID=A0A3N4UXB5_9RHOB|nr:hypothetical protein [Pacificibacter maritimus]RPE72189.1 hypothetical protein EDD53_1338 [Pacificibacter maritimus]